MTVNVYNRKVVLDFVTACSTQNLLVSLLEVTSFGHKCNFSHLPSTPLCGQSAGRPSTLCVFCLSYNLFQQFVVTPNTHLVCPPLLPYQTNSAVVISL